MTITTDQAAWFADAFARLVDNVDTAIVGKRHQIELVVAAMLAGGHVLLEDVPGTGKTVLAKALAATVDGASSRIQFTPDLLPSDVTGVSIFDQTKGAFEFHRGPIFAQIVLADEINRASPKTQSALLEVMEEGVVTIDGQPHAVGAPFLVIATQNPVEQAGTYRLPEAQLDRFLIKTSLGYPDRATTVQLLLDSANRQRAALVHPIVDPASIVTMTRMAEEVHADPAIMEYLADLVQATRSDRRAALGVSMRGGIAFARAVKTWAVAHGRNHVIPDDVRDLALPVLGHRVIVDPESEFAGVTSADVIERALTDVQAPSVRA